jgi:Uma2 family endonuclease
MVQATTSKPAFATVAELLARLGDIPPHRVRLDPAPGTAKEKDVVKIAARENRLYELVEGVLVEKVMGFYESYLACVLIRILGTFVADHDLGIVAGEAGMMRLAKGLVRIPDVSFVSWDRLPGRKIPRKPIPRLAPDLAVEIVSVGNTEKEMTRKLHEYVTAGVRLVWYIEAKARVVRVYKSPKRCKLLSKGQSLDGGKVLPGFALPIRELFAGARREADNEAEPRR